MKRMIGGIISLLPVCSLLYLALLPVELRFAVADLQLLVSICVLLVIVFFLSMRWYGYISVTPLDCCVVLWLIYILGRTYFGNEYPCALSICRICSMFLLYVSLRLWWSVRTMSASVLVWGGLFWSCVEAFIGLSQLWHGYGRHCRFVMTGNFLNPGPYAASLMMGIVIAMVLARFCNKDKQSALARWIMLFLVVLLPAVWSRAALFSVILCALWMYRKSYWHYRYWLWGGITLVSVVLYCLKQGSADGRLVIWMASLTSWLHAPWFGWGIGGFADAVGSGISELYLSYPDSTLFDSAGVTGRPFNIIIAVLVEQGIVGLLLALVFGLVFLSQIRCLSTPLFWGMVSLFLFSMFSYPFELLPYQIAMVMVAAWCSSQNIVFHRFKVIWLHAMIPLFLCLVLYKEISYRHSADEEALLISRHAFPSFLDDCYRLLPLELDHPQFLFNYAKILRESGRYHDSNAVLRNGSLVSADPMFFVLMGNNYKDMGFYRKAEESYQYAYSMMPNRLYPIYQLMKLYRDTSHHSLARKMAGRILQMKPKVESPATNEMVEQARELLLIKKGGE